MWDLIVSVSDHCLSFYFTNNINVYNKKACTAMIRGLSCAPKFKM